jgi:mono/diheme cytochrome c family protein
MRMSNVTRFSAPAIALMAILLSACAPDPERRELQFMPDMYRNPALKPQERYEFLKGSSAMLVPPEGTVPRGFSPYPFTVIEGEKAGEALRNPLPRTREVLEIGRKYYNIHCAVCHGVVGSGDGLVTLVHREAGMPVPPSLYTEKIAEWPDGLLYHTISMGQGQMPGYAARIDPMHRWAIVHYVRALEAAANPSEVEVEMMQRRGIDPRVDDNPYLSGADAQLFLGGTN